MRSLSNTARNALPIFVSYWTMNAKPLKLLVIKELESCIVWNNTIQYSPDAVRYPGTNCLLSEFDDA